MKKIVLYEFDNRNKDRILDEIDNKDFYYLSVGHLVNNNIETVISLIKKRIAVLDITPFFKDEERVIAFSIAIETFIEKVADEAYIYYIIDKRYTYVFQGILGHCLKEIKRFEEELELQQFYCKSITELSDNELQVVMDSLNRNLIGNMGFKSRINEQLRKYKVFYKLGYQPVFSVLISGPSGVGKTEVARILNNSLSPSEQLIKINFGNYSDQNSLSSLIGSPRGYIGSNKGELSEKINSSHSRVILIDEFEKSNKQIHNFFLQLLEDGMFTDSLGRDYDLNGYIIIFTANVHKSQISSLFSKELLSRFDLIYTFNQLSTVEKQEYVDFKSESIIMHVQEKYGVFFSEEQIKQIKDINVDKYINMRNVNGIIKDRISQILYSDYLTYIK